MLPHQAVQRGSLGTVALVLERGAVRRRPPCKGLPASGVHDGPMRGEPAWSQAARRVLIAPKATRRRVPSTAGQLCVIAMVHVRQLQGREIRTTYVADGSIPVVRQVGSERPQPA